MTMRTRLKRLSGRLFPDGVLVVRGPSGRRQIALTFDDGPNERTGEYVRLLERLGVRATFFLVGENAVARRDDVLALLAHGHEIFGHGYSHTHFTRFGRPALQRELEATAAVLPVGRRKAVRPPGGIVSLRSVALTAAAGYSTILWSVDSRDSKGQSVSDICESLAPEQLTGGDIVLLHEGQSWTLEALPRVCDVLREAGFELVPVGELLGW